MKQPKITITDAKKRINTKTIKTYRVRSVAGNGEILCSSENLESVGAVKKHIEAMKSAWASSWLDIRPVTIPGAPIHRNLYDQTGSQVFANKGLALPKQ